MADIFHFDANKIYVFLCLGFPTFTWTQKIKTTSPLPVVYIYYTYINTSWAKPNVARLLINQLKSVKRPIMWLESEAICFLLCIETRSQQPCRHAANMKMPKHRTFFSNSVNVWTTTISDFHHPILDTRISFLRLSVCHAQGNPQDSKMWLTGELWSKTNLLKWQN